MAFEPKKITKEHVLAAVRRIEASALKLNPSTKFDVIINGKAYPPKEVMKYAHQEMNGEFIWDENGGDPANSYLEDLGFEIEYKVSNKMTHLFKSTIEKLKNAIENDSKIEFKRLKEYWAWFGDKQGMIGNAKTHYEVYFNKEENLISVDLHFEGPSKKPKRQFQPILDELSAPLTEIPWQGWKSIRYGEGISLIPSNLNSKVLGSDELVAELKYQLLGLEDKIGDKVRAILGKSNTEKPDNDNTMSIPLNQILFGPPGTGKTFNTINKAIAIINPEFNLDQPRNLIKEEYDRLVKAGQIVFTTFHQSMSYEDFIEGIKPLEPQSDDQFVKYKIQNGIFKKACALAAFNCYEALNAAKNDPVKYSFDDLYEAYIGSIQEQLKQQKPPIYQSFRGREVEVKAVNSNHSIIARAKNSVAPSSAPLTKENLQKLYDRFKTIDQIKDLGEVRETVQILPRITEFYAVFKGLKEFEKNFEPDEQLILEAKEVGGLNIEEIEKNFEAGVYRQAMRECGEGNKTVSPVVVIIDEINRGNVSQIFGELITLIEEDKRMGKLESLEVMLTYSKKMFGVPPNLYIIGTMNTADRSVEALDTALRRRFSFEEIPPRPELVSPQRKIWETWWKYPDIQWWEEPYKSAEANLYALLGISKNDQPDTNLWNKMKLEKMREDQIEKFKDVKCTGINLQKLLETINQRIEKFLDRDHQIGHSYFMSVASLDDLKVAFQNKIIPLLQEYFFGDYGKIGLVLGKGFVRKKDDSFSFAKFDYYEDAGDLQARDVFELIRYAPPSAKTDEDFINAINLLMNKN